MSACQDNWNDREVRLHCQVDKTLQGKIKKCFSKEQEQESGETVYTLPNIGMQKIMMVMIDCD